MKRNLFISIFKKVIVLTSLIVSVFQTANAQPYSTNYSNFGLTSNNDAKSIFYNSIVGHTANFFYYLEDYKMFGYGPNYNNTAQEVVKIDTKFPITGDVLDVAYSGTSTVEQYLFLTTTGLYRSNGTTIGGAVTTFTLPGGLTPTDVKMIAHSTVNGVNLLVTKSGLLYSISNTGVFTSILDASTGNPITNIIAAKGKYALSADNKMYCWGNSYLGDGGTFLSRTNATQMILPVGVTVKMFTFNHSTSTNTAGSVHILGTNGQVYSLGTNTKLEAFSPGAAGTPNQTWYTAQESAGVTLTNVAWIAGNEFSNAHNSLFALRKNGQIWAMGGGNQVIGNSSASPTTPFVYGDGITGSVTNGGLPTNHIARTCHMSVTTSHFISMRNWIAGSGNMAGTNASQIYGISAADINGISTFIGAGTIDCSKSTISPAPVVGTVSNHTLIVTVNVTSPGQFIVSVFGSGMSLQGGQFVINASTTGVQTFGIPLVYDGTALGTLEYTVGDAGTCTADLTTGAKKVTSTVWSVDNCSSPLAAPSLK